MGKSKNNLNPFILWLEEIGNSDQPLVGGKAANIGKLIKESLNCPPGFCITTEAFDFYLSNSKIRDKILAILKDKSKPNESAALEIKDLLQEAKIPTEVKRVIVRACKKLQNQEGEKIPLAVRSSATVEDLRDASFAGQFDSFLGVVSEKNLIQSIKKCWNSLFNVRSIAYIRRKRLKTAKLKMGVIVQRLVMAKAAGVMFTVHPVTLKKNHLLIESTPGLGNQLVSGKVTPDIFVVEKNTLKVIQQTIAKKKTLVKFDPKTKKLAKAKVATNLQTQPSLKMKEIKKLGKIGKQIEGLFLCPQDIEWAIENDKIFIVQTRPITVI